MEKKRKTRINDDLSTFILLSLLKEGELDLKELQAHTALQFIQFDTHHNRRHAKIQKPSNLAETCDGLVCKKWLKLTDQSKYQLTEEGKAQAEVNAKAIERGAALL
jgi:hypothetical protein